MIEVQPYRSEHKQAWDQLVKGSKNGTFLFLREYMDYHADRFEDASLLFFDDGKLVGVLPASRQRSQVISHGGLSYGGVICTAKMTAARMLEIFQAMQLYYRQNGIKILRYKVMPTIYHRQPAQEDLYALFLADAQLYRVDVSTTVDLANPIAFSKGRRHAVAKARKAGLQVERSENFAAFWNILENVLAERHGTLPTHSLDEIQLLASRFPEHISLYSAYQNHQMLAGAIVYDCEQVIHSQYLATNSAGREVGALDLILHHLIKEVYTHRHYFDFGISTENQGRYLNEGLIAQKEMFGGRAIAHLFYEIDLVRAHSQ